MKYLLFIALGASFLLSLPARGSEVLLVEEGFAAFIVADPWSPATLEKAYRTSTSDNAHGIYTFVAMPPLSGFVGAFITVMGRFSDEAAAEIADYCRGFPEVWDKIVCASQSIHLTLRQVAWNSSDFSDDMRLFCSTHAYAFLKVFRDLEIPRSASGVEDATFRGFRPHVVNSFVLTAPNGTTYGYIIDVGNMPKLIFPSSMAAKAFHDSDGDGSTDIRFLPTHNFLQPGVKYYGAQPPTE